MSYSRLLSCFTRLIFSARDSIIIARMKQKTSTHIKVRYLHRVNILT
nr:MAG TPA: hypothetical protein [Caudoviricetes sp.]